MANQNIIYSQDDLKKLSYYENLVKIQSVLRGIFPDFPYNFCNLSARVVFLTLDLPEVGGHLYNLSGVKLTKANWHAFNHDPENRVFVCLTAYQYNSIFSDTNFPEITVIPDSFAYFLPILKYTQFQRNLNLNPFGLEDVLNELKNVLKN
ncbi:MAG: hypothetical protein QW806_10415 [Nitrososphaerota archaeon]